ncbi:MAG: preprotein translocase subunit SecA [Alphaproteobacteria bacterium]|nr:preprotein translocase subunit SecA [Alphaproteobacteria bacterium]
MLAALTRNIFGTANERFLKQLRPVVGVINALEPKYAAMSDEELRAQTDLFRKRLQDGEKLDRLLPEAFAVVREAAKRTLGQRHFDVQLLGGMVLHQGKIAEMRTGEGKTLVATLPAYLNALTGKGVHIVTVNDYLAQRDSGWMGRVHSFLGLKVGCIVHGLNEEERRQAYAADITYGTNHEFGFDYLRDNMKFRSSDLVQRPFNYAVVDEVDSILIDEARTPLIISGPAEDSSELYRRIDEILVKHLKPDVYEKDEKSRTVNLTESGMVDMESWLSEAGLLNPGGLYDSSNVNTLHHVQQGLRAHTLFTRDVDYIVKDNKLVIIDEFTGRMMEGRRYGEGLHQALEAKEHVTIERENQTLASITYQNYFRLYPKLSGMTGTALTEAAEFEEIYNLSVVDMPTNVPVQRIDHDDVVFRTAAEKYNAIIDVIEECRKRQQPVLVGTVSIEKSELLSELLKKRKIAHNVLNARYHEQEAYIIAQAGRPGAVTIATNMAGRGTDIQLGGNLDMRIAQEAATLPDEAARSAKAEEIRKEVEAAREIVRQAGGLYVIGTERHESRRIDNQLRGRSGRQGDPGTSSFFLSLQDDLLRIYGADKMDAILASLGLRDGQSIEHPWISRALLKAQEKVEARNFDIRKNLLKFDNIMNDQRKVIYEQRREIMNADNVSETVTAMRHDVIENMVRVAVPANSYPEQWSLGELRDRIKTNLHLDLPVEEWGKEDGIAEGEFEARIKKAADEKYASKINAVEEGMRHHVEKLILLSTLDQVWKDHLLALDHLRSGIGLRAYGQRDPLNEYGREAFDLFSNMLDLLRVDATSRLLADSTRAPTEEEVLAQRRGLQMIENRGGDDEPASIPEGMARRAAGSSSSYAPTAYGKGAAAVAATGFDAKNPATWGKVQRNSPCPCGSGKKFKHCHGSLE